MTTLIWGVNYAVVKAALRHIPELAFNSLRLAVASLLFLGVLAFWPGPRPSAGLFPTARRIPRRDWAVLAALSVIGQFVYQLCFLGGIARTTVANSALIQGSSPVVITVIAVLAGQENVRPRHWLGVGLSLAGIYLLVGTGAGVSRASLWGDALMLIGVCCWATYVVGSRPLLERHSPLAVSGYSMAIGTLLYFPLGVPQLRALHWSAVSPAAWAALVYSAVFSLFLAYVVWYTSIQRVGNVRTAAYSNLIPVVAMLTAVFFLGDRLQATDLAGAAVILAGVALARHRTSQPTTPPAEE